MSELNGAFLFYENDFLSSKIEVRLENESVWLSQSQMADLFKTSKANINIHLKNIFNEGELNQHSVIKDYLTTAHDGKKYKTLFYNLDVIISVGYRVKSIIGTHFRIWANSVLKNYLISEYQLNQRMHDLEVQLNQVQIKTKDIEIFIHSQLPPQQGVFFDGQIFDAYVLVSKLIKSAKKSIHLFDNYCDETILMLLSKREKEVGATVFLNHLGNDLKLDLLKHNKQYPKIEVKIFKKSHDRFLIIDRNEIYHIGASLKDLGKKWFAFSKLQNQNLTEMLDLIQH